MSIEREYSWPRPVTVLNRKVFEADFVLKVALPPDRIESSSCTFLSTNEGRSNGNLDVIPWGRNEQHSTALLASQPASLG